MNALWKYMMAAMPFDNIWMNDANAPGANTLPIWATFHWEETTLLMQPCSFTISDFSKSAKRNAWLIFHCLVSSQWKHRIFGLKRFCCICINGKKAQLWTDKLEQTYRGECPITIPDPISWPFLQGLQSTQSLGLLEQIHHILIYWCRYIYPMITSYPN